MRNSAESFPKTDFPLSFHMEKAILIEKLSGKFSKNRLSAEFSYGKSHFN